MSAVIIFNLMFVLPVFAPTAPAAGFTVSVWTNFSKKQHKVFSRFYYFVFVTLTSERRGRMRLKTVKLLHGERKMKVLFNTSLS